MREPAPVRSALAAVVSSALLLIGVVSGLAGGVGAAGAIGAIGAGSLPTGASSPSRSSIPALATAGPRTMAPGAERRQPGALSTPRSQESTPGGAPVDPPFAELPPAGWPQPSSALAVADVHDLVFSAVAVPGTQQSRAPPAGIAPV